MTLQYLEALKSIGQSPSTKYVIPIEFTRLLEPVQEFLNPADGAGGDGQGAQRRTIAPPPAEPPGA
jgi:hypothetical protein